MEIESITEQYTPETPCTTQQFQYFKASPSQLRTKLFTAVIFSCSSQVHSSLERQQGASEIRYQTFSEKQSPAYSTLPPPHICLASPTQQSCTRPSALQLYLGVSPFFFLVFFFKLLKTSNSISFSRKESLPKVMYCSVS